MARVNGTAQMFFQLVHETIKTQYEKMHLQPCMSSEDSDQPAHMYSLITVFARHSVDSKRSKESSSG